MKKRQTKKMTLRGYQTALGIARRKNYQMKKSLIEQTRRADNAESDLTTVKACLVDARDTINDLRRVLGDCYPTSSNVKYRRACLALNLDDREYRTIPPMNIHVTQNGYGYGFCEHVQSYIFDLYIPDGEALDFKTASIIHDSLHKLVDFVEYKPTKGEPPCS